MQSRGRLLECLRSGLCGLYGQQSRRRRFAMSRVSEALEARVLLTTFSVTTTSNSGPGSLRQAIADANASSGADVIEFSGSLFLDATPDTILLTSGRLTISDDLEIRGTGAALLRIDAAGSSQLFYVTGAATDVTISDVTLAGGRAGGSTLNTQSGGAVYNNNARLILEQVTLTGNTAALDGGALYNASGTVSVIDSTVTANSTVRGGGGLATNGLMDVSGGHFAGNDAQYGGGIVVGQQGTLDLQTSFFTDNSASIYGSGVHNYMGTATVESSTFLSNNSGTGGPITNLGSLWVTDSTFEDNITDYGGGIANTAGGTVVVTRSTFRNNFARLEGGGILNAYGGTVTVIDSTFTGNSATVIGGAVALVRESSMTISGSTMSDNSSRLGGAINNTHDSVLSVVNSTISGNRADEGGGGIFNNGDMTVTNSTIVHNRADADGNDTGGAGGIFTHNRPSVRTHLFNSIVVGNFRGAPGDDVPNDIGGFKPIESDSAFNVIGSPTDAGGLVHGVNGNIVGQSGTGGVRILLPVEAVINVTLADNGGPTLTHALATGSVAIDAGSNLLAIDDEGLPLVTDQRGAGFSRINGAFVDIGAFEA